MLNERTVSIADAHWASHLGCLPEELFTESFRILTQGGELSDYCGAFALFRGAAVTASIPPDRADTLRAVLSGLSHGCSPSSFASALGSVATAVIGPADIGYAAAVPQPVHPSSGVFAAGQLVTVAGYEVWGGSIAHISVVSHPDFRGHGFGRSAVAHLAERAIRAGLLPQYRTLDSNRSSIRIAELLGFQSYATSTAVRLNRNA